MIRVKESKIQKIMVLLLVIISFSLFSLAGCAKKASDFTEEEHIERVTARIEKRFMTEEAKYTSFSVYPLYNENDELNYFLVEFEPHGFIYVLLRDEQLKGFAWLGASTSMYKLSNLYGNETWSPYTIDETDSQPSPETDKIWQLDENGEKVVYNISPYKVAKVVEEKKYLLQTESQSARQNEHHKTSYYIPAVRTDKNFFNLISNSAFHNSNVLLENIHATMNIPFIAKKQFDL